MPGRRRRQRRLVDRAEAMNDAKDQLRERCTAISHLRVRMPVKDGKGGRAVYRKTRAEIATMIEATGRLSAAEDVKRLHGLPQRETHLALVKERYTNIRAKLWFHGLDARSRGRVMVSAELPLLYPLGRSKDLPEIVYPPAEEGSAPPARHRTGKLEDQPFLDSLPVYRYRPAPSRRLGR